MLVAAAGGVKASLAGTRSGKIVRSDMETAPER